MSIPRVMIPDRAPLSGSRWSHTSALSCHPRMVEGVGKWKVGCTSNWCNQQETLVSYGFIWFLVNADRVLLKKIQTPAIQNWMCLTMIAENNYHWKNLYRWDKQWLNSDETSIFFGGAVPHCQTNPSKHGSKVHHSKLTQNFGSSGHPALTKATRNDGEPPEAPTLALAYWPIFRFARIKWCKQSTRRNPTWHHFVCDSGSLPLVAAEVAETSRFFPMFSVAEINPWLKSRPPPALPKAPRPLSHRRTCSKVKPYLTGSFTTKKSMAWFNEHEPTIIGIY